MENVQNNDKQDVYTVWKTLHFQQNFCNVPSEKPFVDAVFTSREEAENYVEREQDGTYYLRFAEWCSPTYRIRRHRADTTAIKTSKWTRAASYGDLLVDYRSNGYR